MVWRAAFLVLSAISWPCSALISTSNVKVAGITARLLGEKFGVAAGGLIKFDVNFENWTSRLHADTRKYIDAESHALHSIVKYLFEEFDDLVQEPPPDARFHADLCSILSDMSRSTAYIVVVGGKTSEWFENLLGYSLDRENPPPVCVAPSAARFEVSESASFNFTVVQHEIYSAYLLLCRSDEIFYGEITSTFINLNPEGDLTQHLPIEKTMLPSLYALMAVVYAGFAVAWMSELARLHEHVLRIHYLCLSCVLAKLIEMILWAVYYDQQNKEGQGQDTLYVVVIFMYNIYRLIFLLTLLLFSLGWGFVRPSLRSKEGWLVVVTIGFYACVSLLAAGCQDADSALCGGLGFMEYAIRSLVLLSTVVAINFNISHIRLCIQLPWTSSSALEYLKLNRYLSFRMIFLVYLLLPTALVVVKYAVLSWEYEWVYYAMEEFVVLLILVNLGTTFAPFNPWLLTRAFDHSLEQENS